MSIRSLKAEITSSHFAARVDVRYDEQNALRHARELRLRQRLHAHGMNGKQIGRILRSASARGLRREQSGLAFAMTRVKNGNLAQTQVESPEPEWIDKAHEHYSDLHDMRTQKIRIKARARYAAYAFLRGKPFSSVESMSYTPPPFDLVAQIVQEHTDDDPRVALQRLAEWIDSAGWEKREVVRNMGYSSPGVRKMESIGQRYRNKHQSHESYTHESGE